MKTKGEIRILGISELTSGSRYHRIELPILALDDKKVRIRDEEHVIKTSVIGLERRKVILTEDMFEKNDYIWCTWLCANPAWQIDYWKNKWNCKYIQDWDDGLPSVNHPYLGNKADILRPLVIQNTLIADAVTVTNEVLANEFGAINNRILLHYNILPYGEGMYNDEKTECDKIRIGLVGSNSHYNDWKALSGIIKRISNDSEIQKKCKWVLGGYIPNDKNWASVLKMLQCNKNMEVGVIVGRDPDKYMEVFKEIDIIIGHLEETSFNKAKSALLLSSAACKNIPVISNNYEKELSGYLKTRNIGDYYKVIKSLIKNNSYIEWGKKLGEINRNRGSFESRIESLRLMIEQIENNPLKLKPENLNVYSITYEEGQYGEYENVFNWRKKPEDGSIFFEYLPMLDAIDVENSEYVGIFSWKMPFKNGISKTILYKLFKEFGDPDIINLTPHYKGLSGRFIEWTDSYHPTFMDKFKVLCDKLGLKYAEPKNIIFSNMVIMKREVYKDYLENYIKPAIELFKGELFEMGMENARYTAGLDAEECEKAFGLPYYPFTTFLLERLMGVYIDNKNLTIKNVLQ